MNRGTWGSGYVSGLFMGVVGRYPCMFGCIINCFFVNRGFAIDLNYLVPKALFDALEETLFTFKSDDDRRKQTLDRSSTVVSEPLRLWFKLIIFLAL